MRSASASETSSLRDGEAHGLVHGEVGAGEGAVLERQHAVAARDLCGR